MSFDEDARAELAPVPLMIAPTREQRARWLARAQALGLDLHGWMTATLDREAVTALEPRARRLVGAERGRQ